MAATGDVEHGVMLMRTNGCLNCHSTDGTAKVGPTFQGLWGKHEAVTTNGAPREVVVDEAYVARSLREPDADLAAGYKAGAMPKLDASDDDVRAIAAVLESPRALSDAENLRARTIWSIAIAGAIFAVLFIVFTVVRSRRENARSQASKPRSAP